MNAVRLCLEKAIPGSTAIGATREAAMYGLADAGIGRRMLVRIGAIRTMTTTRMAGTCTKATGITRIMVIIMTTIATKV